jgi:hypothetical protein
MLHNNIYLSIAITFCWHTQATAQDKCSDVLAQGFYNTTKANNTGDYSSDVVNWLKSDNSHKYADKQGGGFNIAIPIEGVPIGFGANMDGASSTQLNQKLNAGNKAKFNNTFANYVAQQIVDKTVIKAWSDCMNRDKIGLQGEASPMDDGRTIILSLRWAPRFGINTSKLKYVAITGATYDAATLQVGQTFGTENYAVVLTRLGNQPVVVNINLQDNLGSYTTYVATKQDSAEPDSVLNRLKKACYAGDSRACEEAFKIANQQCEKIASPADWQRKLKCQRDAMNLEDMSISLQQVNEAESMFGKNSVQAEEARKAQQRVNKVANGELIPFSF